MNKENMSVEEALKELYDRAMVNNCTEYLEGVQKYPPQGYGDQSLKDWWNEAVEIIQQQRAAAVAEYKAETVNVIMSGEENPLMVEIRERLSAELMPLVSIAVAIAKHCKQYGTAPLDELVQVVDTLSPEIIKLAEVE